MELSVLFKRALHPAPAIRPSPATLECDRFDEIVIDPCAVPKLDEIAARAIEFLTLR
jgi:hypothetical protein